MSGMPQRGLVPTKPPWEDPQAAALSERGHSRAESLSENGKRAFRLVINEPAGLG
jgi:hypothetical protein